MSREIKFRAWVNEHWVDWLPNSKTLGEYNEVGIYADEYNTESKCYIEQYTGLRDKNGKEIYEGDIVKDDSGRKGKVYFDEGKLAYLFSDPHSWNQWWLRSEFGEHEVIGNIHENPELLGGEE